MNGIILHRSRSHMYSIFKRLLSGSPTQVNRQPTEPSKDTPKSDPAIEEIDIDCDLIARLERISLVDFSNDEGIERLKRHIKAANDLLKVDVTGVKPLFTVLENRQLYLDEDVEKIDNTRDDILRNAAVTDEEYFVAPPGNKPLKQDKARYKEKHQ